MVTKGPQSSPGMDLGGHSKYELGPRSHTTRSKSQPPCFTEKALGNFLKISRPLFSFPFNGDKSTPPAQWLLGG